MEWDRVVHKLQVDITSHCNAKCAACIRNKNGGETNPELVLEHFDISVWQRLCESDTQGWFIQKLSLNGNWGDSGMHPGLPGMLETFIKCHPETEIVMSTNGSMQTEKFWQKLAQILNKAYRHEVDFAVDGMKDTHAVYRRNTNFDRLVKNIKSFTENGGHASVVMTLFEHNEHQVEDVKQLSDDLGANRFYTRTSHTKFMVVDDDVKYHILGSDTATIQKVFPRWNQTEIRDRNLYDEFHKIVESRIDKTASKCVWYQNAEIQIDPWGTVWSCCHISMLGVDNKKHVLTNEADDSILNAREQNSLKSNTLGEILRNSWFTTNVSEAVENADWTICKRKCGVTV